MKATRLNRRRFLQTAFGGGVAGAAGLIVPDRLRAAAPGEPFRLNYAPHFGTFENLAGKDEIAQIEFAYGQGFRAWEDNRLKERAPALQEKIGRTLERLGMTMGVFVAHGSLGRLTFAKKDAMVWQEVLREIRESVEVARRVGAKWMTVVPGNVDESLRARLAEGYQTANVVDLLRRCAEIVEPHGLIMVLEPLNWHSNHGGAFLSRSDQAYALCKAVNSPACKILFDCYHQQITEGNLINNLDLAWDEIAYLQVGDNPGRKEPTTGEIAFRHVFRHLHNKGYIGVVGMEHGNSRQGPEGERAVIAAYREMDAF